MASKYNLVQGVYVQEVYDGTSAKKVGIKQGDVIIRIDDIEITTFEGLNAYKNSKEIGDTINITVYRNGENKEFKIKLVSSDE